MDDFDFLCNYDGHDEEEIIGFCLNKSCQQVTQFCLKCCWEKHGDHEDDCKTFKQIQKLLQNNKQQQIGQSDDVNNKLKSIQQICEQLSQSKNIGYEKLDEIEKYLKQKEYKSCLGNIKFLKNIQDANQSNQCKLILVYQLELILEQLDNVLQTLNTLGQQQIPNQITSQSENTKNIQKAETKDQEIQVNIIKQEDEINKKQTQESLQPKEKLVPVSFGNQQINLCNNDQMPRANSYQSTLQEFYSDQTSQLVNPCQTLNNQNPIQQNSKSQQPSLQVPATSVPQIPTNDICLNFYVLFSSIITIEQSMQQGQIQQKSNSSQSQQKKQKFEEQLNREISKNPEYQNMPQPLIKLTDQEWEKYKTVIQSAQHSNKNFVLEAEVATYNDDELEKVLEQCDKFLEYDPLNFEKHLLKGQTLIKAKKYIEALEQSEFIMDMNPNNYQPYILKGLALNQLKRYEEALHNYCISIQIEPIFEAYFLQGISLMAINQLDDAIASFENSIRMRPDIELGYYHMGCLALMRKEKYDQAIKYFEIALRIAPKYDQALKQKNLCLRELEERQKAIQKSDASIQRAESEEVIYFKKGYSQLITVGLELFKEQKYNAALPQFEKAIQINNQMHEAHVYKGETLNQLGRLIEAVKSFDEGLKIQPRPQYMIKKADTLKEMNNNEEAQMLYQKAQSIISKEQQNPLWK
ncbi:unnamed protein product (macronuclear) [Paramecium tetraurelia]|uniref:Uncharacterized protein n=1 Tax=Paramecium tetraurelia TaxID=5888 RepID=A0E2F1_PARTE|nr:uncharacterized protein GSPATT00022640001 [Paramecium tetraurelia]CAK89468.1 unnamed protein product [Paramecium tetraurelia]|eukprot:XP_001456865.1 hypothetical protein (macronuclear) [Paramecium tetraurelia strain d4-2]